MAIKTKPNEAPPLRPRDGLAKIQDAMEFLSVCRRTVYRMMDTGEIPWRAVGRVRRIPWEALHRYASGR